jgi:hypothetical protein
VGFVVVLSIVFFFGDFLGFFVLFFCEGEFFFEWEFMDRRERAFSDE